MGENMLFFLEELVGCSGALAPPACLTAVGCGGRRQLWQWETGVAKINSELQPWLGELLGLGKSLPWTIDYF